MGGQAEQLVKMAALIPQVQHSYGNMPAATTHAPSRTSSTRIRGRTASGAGSGGSVHGFEESHRNLAPSLDNRVSGGKREVNQGLGILEANRNGVLGGDRDRKHADCLTSFSLLSSSSPVHLGRAGGKEGGTMRSSQNLGPPSIDSLTDERCVNGGVVSGSIDGMALADWDGKEQLLLKSLKAKWSKN